MRRRVAHRRIVCLRFIVRQWHSMQRGPTPTRRQEESRLRHARSLRGLRVEPHRRDQARLQGPVRQQSRRWRASRHPLPRAATVIKGLRRSLRRSTAPVDRRATILNPLNCLMQPRLVSLSLWKHSQSLQHNNTALLTSHHVTAPHLASSGTKLAGHRAPPTSASLGWPTSFIERLILSHLSLSSLPPQSCLRWDVDTHRHARIVTRTHRHWLAMLESHIDSRLSDSHSLPPLDAMQI